MNIDIALPSDRENILSDLRSIERFCFSNSHDYKAAFQLLFEYWEEAGLLLWNLGYWRDYFYCGEIVFKAAKFLQNIEEEAQLLSELSYVYMEWEKFETAEILFKESLEKYRSIQHFRCECRGLRYLGELAYRQKSFDLALDYYEQSLRIVKSQPFETLKKDSKWTFQEARLDFLVGSVYLELPEPNIDSSYQKLHSSLNKFRDMGNEWKFFQPEPILKLGKYHFIIGSYVQARQYYQDCLDLSKEIDRRDTLADVLLHLAELCEAENKIEEAFDLAQQSFDKAGIEIFSVRERAVRFQKRLQEACEGSNRLGV